MLFIKEIVPLIKTYETEIAIIVFLTTGTFLIIKRHLFFLFSLIVYIGIVYIDLLKESIVELQKLWRWLLSFI